MTRSGKALIVGIGGTVGPVSSTERAPRVELAEAGQCGFHTQVFGGDHLAKFPHYAPHGAELSEAERGLVDAVPETSTLIIASPGYHGSVSGLVKNAFDVLRETASDARCYLSEMPVGLIVTAHVSQACGPAIATLRSIVHALRGYPSPFAAAIDSLKARSDEGSGVGNPRSIGQLQLLGGQVARFAGLLRASHAMSAA